MGGKHNFDETNTSIVTLFLNLRAPLCIYTMYVDALNNTPSHTHVKSHVVYMRVQPRAYMIIFFL